MNIGKGQFFAMNRALSGVLVVMISLFLAFSSVYASGEASLEQHEVKKLMGEMMQIMTPPLKNKVKNLSKPTQKALFDIYSKHNRHSKNLTLRQVMHEVLADYQTMVAGILVDNGEQAADAARRLANHRIPRGGLIPYLKLENVNDEKLGVLVPMNDLVEGNALRFAAAAEQGDFQKAASLLSDITAGCISCHQIFRGQPGKTELLIENKE